MLIRLPSVIDGRSGPGTKASRVDFPLTTKILHLVPVPSEQTEFWLLLSSHARSRDCRSSMPARFLR